jgi:hypothetical protein
MNDNESDGIENAFPKLTWILVFFYLKNIKHIIDFI